MEILFLLIFAPFILMIIGVIQLTRSDLVKKKNGKKLLLAGIGLLGVELLIGYSICSNMNFGGMH
jgi:multisubunit Na+/H+ antiporter MnhC subunit